jgi:hypothetical protein
MKIKLGREIQATTSGASYKTVHCEQCSQEYSYRIERTGTGEGFAWLFMGSAFARSEAKERADRDLRKLLQQSHDLVPCPSCGWVQAEMVKEARNQKHGWLTAVSLLAGFVFLYALSGSLGGNNISRDLQMKIHITTVCSGLLAFGGAFLQAFLRKRFDPNDWPLSQKLELARVRCLPGIQYDTNESEVAEPDRSKYEKRRRTSRHRSQMSDAEVKAEPGSLSSADEANGWYFVMWGLGPAVVGFLVLMIDPWQWRALAAFGLTFVLWFFAYRSFSRKT